jgi:molybdenum cofactor biosynthesis enzyme MoaA
MTPSCGVSTQPQEINWRNFAKSARFAKSVGATTALITGKGEPMLFPHELTIYIEELNANGFEFIELQTNGSLLEKMNDFVDEWYDLGLTHINISVAHNDIRKNMYLLTGKDDVDFDYWTIFDQLNDVGFTTRVNCTVFKSGIDSTKKAMVFLEDAKDRVHQVTFRDVTAPEQSEDREAYDWVQKHKWEDGYAKIHEYLRMFGARKVLELGFGAEVFDLNGQNVAIHTCLTSSTDPNEIRQLIFFPDGRLRYDWKYPGALLL